MEDQSAIKGKIKYKKGMRPKISHFWSNKGEQNMNERRREKGREEEEEEEEKKGMDAYDDFVWIVWKNQTINPFFLF